MAENIENIEKETAEAAADATTETANQEKKKAEKSEKKSKNEAVKLQAELDKATAELANAKDMLLRTAAEFDNFKRRSEKEKSDIAAYVRAEVAKELIAVADNIDRARLADPESADYIKGLELIIKQLTESLDRIGLRKIEAEGAEFDPNFHEAVMHVEDDSMADNIVLQELQAGYTVGDIVIRPAMVKVAN